MSGSGKPQLLHLVLGGELVDFEHVTFKDLEKSRPSAYFRTTHLRIHGLESEGAADRR